jgi:hypothetical protein
MGVTAGVIGARLPFRSVPDIGPRYRYFEQTKEDVDTLFIGSSRFRHQVIPAEFDAATTSAGAPTHSLNLGYSGMWPPESFYFLRRLLALQPHHLRWVFIELMDHRFSHVEQETPTLRNIYWHDWPHTVMAWRMVWETPFPPEEKVRLLARDTSMFLRQFSNIGRAAEWLQERNSAKGRKLPLGWVHRGGFEPEEEGVWSEASRVEYSQMVDAVKTGHPAQRARPGYAVALREVIQEVRAAGAEPIFVLPPTVRPEEFLATGLPEGMTIWAFNDPERYPALYDADLHFDPGHLNERGAHEFTRLLAQRMADLQKGKLSTFSSAMLPSR